MYLVVVNTLCDKDDGEEASVLGIFDTLDEAEGAIKDLKRKMFKVPSFRKYYSERYLEFENDPDHRDNLCTIVYLEPNKSCSMKFRGCDLSTSIFSSETIIYSGDTPNQHLLSWRYI